MKYTIELEIPENKISFAEEFFKSIAFIKKVKPIFANEITNSKLLKSIEDYETNKLKPTPVNLKELKDLIYA
jgi:hypothetical protein